MQDGYVKLWRKSKESAVFGSDGLWRMWCYCLLEASHKPIKKIVHGKEITIAPGQFTTGRHILGKDLRIKSTTAWKRLRAIQNLGLVTLSSVTKFTIVTVCKWELYQGNNNRVVTQQSDTMGDTTSDTMGDTIGDTLQEAKKLRTKKTTTTPAQPAADAGSASPESNGATAPEEKELIAKVAEGIEQAKKKPDPNPDVTRFIRWYAEEYERRTGAKYLVDGGKDGSAVKKMVQTYGYDQLVQYATRFFEDGDEFADKAGYTITVFKLKVNKVAGNFGGAWPTKHKPSGRTYEQMGDVSKFKGRKVTRLGEHDELGRADRQDEPRGTDRQVEAPDQSKPGSVSEAGGGAGPLPERKAIE